VKQCGPATASCLAIANAWDCIFSHIEGYADPFEGGNVGRLGANVADAWYSCGEKKVAVEIWINSSVLCNISRINGVARVSAPRLGGPIVSTGYGTILR